MALIAGNWKLHKGPRDTRAFFKALALPENAARHELVVFPQTLSLAAAVACPERDARIQVGVQNVHWEQEGAFTGEASARAAAEMGATYALVGHSERRHVFGETDEDVARKLAAIRAAGLVPVLCVGETLEERRAGRVEEVTLGQLRAALDGVDDPGRLLVAYEPVWAIGTGETATPADASAAQGAIRTALEKRLGVAAAQRVPVLYGGSVKPDNAAELLEAPDVDGVLVGGASLDPASLAAIVSAAG